MKRASSEKAVVVCAALILALGGAALGAMDTFDSFTTGVSINGQSGWTVEDQWGYDFVEGGKPYNLDEQIVDDGTGNKVWRISSAYAYSEYSSQPFSPTTARVAGENGSSLWNDRGPDHTNPYNPPHFGANAATDRFHAAFDFRSATGAAQPGLAITLSPSAKQSTVRMSYLRISDNGSSGFDLLFYDTSNGDQNWNPTTVATGLSYSGWHSIVMDIEFVDGVDTGGGQVNGNDVVRVYVDGILGHTGTTWESYYYAEGEGVTEPRLQAVDSLLFRVAGTASPATLGNGFYFDNVQVCNEMATWKVATVHGHDQFTIDDNGNSLLYHQQPRNTQGWYWYNNNGSPPGTLATGGFQTPDGWRDGSRTFACTDVAVGQALNTVKLAFEYRTALGYTTVNYFLTDGNGKFGIFAPTSLGITGVSTIEAIDSEWSRITLDLTGAIPDSTNVAIYEHNGLSTEHVEPFTTMQWGDIKNLQIAGMYDYQRSPAQGWDHWGTMFAPINMAGDPTIVNGFGVALIWGDTVGNTNYATQQRQIRNVEVSCAGVDYVGTFADAQISDVLELNVLSDSVYLKPGESLVVHMDVSNLAQKVNACQALLGYNSDFFNVGSVAAGGGVWDELIYQSWAVSGEINTAIGLDAQGSVGTDADGTVASITMTAKAHEGTTQMVFLPDVSDVKGTYLSDMSAQFVYPTKIDSTTIYVDGTNPAVTVIDPDGGEYLKGGQSSDITWSATDTNIDANSIKIEYYDGSTWQTIATGEANDGTYTWNPVPSLNISTAKVRVTASDLAGNSTSDESDAAFTIDSIAPVVDSISANQGGPELTPSGVALQGTVFIAVATSDNLSGVAGAPTVTVTPNGGSAESATPTGESPPGTYNYTWSVGATTPNGQATITVSGLTDQSGNVASNATDTFNINKNQITGQVQLEGFVGASRVVTFVATGGTTTKTWDLTLTGWASHITSYTLTDAPDGTTHLSAKTAWSLRKKLAVGGGTNGQWTANFTGTEPIADPPTPGTGDYLRGGDLNGSNTINVLDYSILKVKWLTADPAADIDGNGSVGIMDYSIMKSNWFQIGDSQ